MTERKLTTEEIEELFIFCKKHYVEHYDLQIELVDHMASNIEEQWSKNSELSFDAALNQSFSKFGIYGFAKVKLQKQEALQRKYRNLLFRYTLEFYKLPKLILTFAFTLVLFTSIRLVHNPFWIIIPYFFILAGIVAFYFYILFPRRFQIKIKDEKKFMLLDNLKNEQLVLGFLFQIPLQSLSISENMDYHLLSQLIPSLLIYTQDAVMYLYIGTMYIVKQKINDMQYIASII
jgi:hypothetical protein